jgi:hypothetical protein
VPIETSAKVFLDNLICVVFSFLCISIVNMGYNRDYLMFFCLFSAILAHFRRSTPVR